MLEHEFPLFNAEDIERQEKITLENVAQQVSISVRISVSCSCKLRCTGRCRCVKKQPEAFNTNHTLPLWQSFNLSYTDTSSSSADHCKC